MTVAPAPLIAKAPVKFSPALQRNERARKGADATTVAILMFLGSVLVLLAGVGGRAASLAYLALATATGAFLLSRSPVRYSSFCLWILFLTPFVRRILDYRHGWNSTNPALLAPQFIALMGVVTIARHARELRGRLFAPYLLVLGALGYGYSVGVINAGFIPASYALLTLLAPLAFGVHLALSWRQYSELSVVLRKTFTYALPVLGFYGMYQFLRLPVWDSQWMISADMKSIGSPLPFLVRIFGTMNAPGPYAAALATGMLIALSGRGFVRFPVIAVAFLALLLTRTRAVWIAFFIGMIVQQLSLPVVRLPRRIVVLFVVSMLAIPLTSLPIFKNSILPRLSTLKDISQDRSFISRVAFSHESASEIVETAEGNGLGSTGGAIKLGTTGVRALDNGFLELFYVFGWPGGTMFLLGIGALLYQSFKFAEARLDLFASAVRSAGIALVSILPIGDIFSGPTGTLLWAMMGLGISAHAYHLTTGLALRSRALSMRLENSRAPRLSKPVSQADSQADSRKQPAV